ncbi:MAG: cysteine desulfurase family protein [Candidatus Odinarchaeia archaeon]
MIKIERIYLDYAGAAPVDPRVIEAMKPFLKNPANPLALHTDGQNAKLKIEDARRNISFLIKADNPEGVIFTSCATEANNLAIIGMGLRLKNKGKHIITTNIEHISINNSLKFLEKQGFKITKIPVDNDGIINLDKLKESIKKDTIMISVQYANNEIGVIQPINEISKIIEDKDIIFHSDATAAVGIIPVDVKLDNINLLTISSNQFYGPQGVAALYLSKKAKPIPQMLGGGQQRGLRAGTENIAGIVGMGEAAKLASLEMSKDNEKLLKLRDELIKEIPSRIPEVYVNGHPKKRLPNNANFRIDYIEGESIVLSLDILHQISVSTGAACASLTLQPSHAIQAIGVPPEKAHGTIQITMGRFTKQSDTKKLIEVLPSVVERLRKMSPLTPKKLLK